MDVTIKVGVLIINQRKVLLLKEFSERKNGYYWNIVKGTYEEGVDKSLTDCARREAKEEAGVEIGLKNFLGVTFLRTDYTRIYFTFVGKIVKGTPKVTVKISQLKRGEDIKVVKWFTKNEIDKLKADEFISDGTYKAVRKWINGEIYPLTVYSEIVKAFQKITPS